MYKIWKKRNWISSFASSENGEFSLKMHAWGGDVSPYIYIYIYGNRCNFPIRGPKRTWSSSSSSDDEKGQTSGPSKLDGFNRRLIIVWIFHRAIFLSNNVQREIQRSLLSSVGAWIPSQRSTLFSIFSIEIVGIVVLDKMKRNERANEIDRQSRYFESRIKEWKFRSFEYGGYAYLKI